MTLSGRWFAKAFAVGLLNFLARFMVGGALWYGVKLNPEGFAYGMLLTITALIFAVLFMRFLMKPRTLNDALLIGCLWAGFALLLDVLTLGIVFNLVTVPYLLSEAQTWTRAAAVVAAAFVAVKRGN
jgi:hypothetical protein